MATTLVTVSTRAFNIGAFASSNAVVGAVPFPVIRLTFNNVSGVVPGFSMNLGVFRQDGVLFIPVAQTAADSGFAAGQFLQFNGSAIAGQTCQVQLVIAGSPVTMSLLLQGGTSAEFPRQ